MDSASHLGPFFVRSGLHQSTLGPSDKLYVTYITHTAIAKHSFHVTASNPDGYSSGDDHHRGTPTMDIHGYYLEPRETYQSSGSTSGFTLGTFPV